MNFDECDRSALSDITLAHPHLFAVRTGKSKDMNRNDWHLTLSSRHSTVTVAQQLGQFLHNSLGQWVSLAERETFLRFVSPRVFLKWANVGWLYKKRDARVLQLRDRATVPTGFGTTKIRKRIRSPMQSPIRGMHIQNQVSLYISQKVNLSFPPHKVRCSPIIPKWSVLCEQIDDSLRTLVPNCEIMRCFTIFISERLVATVAQQ